MATTYRPQSRRLLPSASQTQGQRHANRRGNQRANIGIQAQSQERGRDEQALGVGAGIIGHEDQQPGQHAGNEIEVIGAEPAMNEMCRRQQQQRGRDDADPLAVQQPPRDQVDEPDAQQPDEHAGQADRDLRQRQHLQERGGQVNVGGRRIEGAGHRDRDRQELAAEIAPGGGDRIRVARVDDLVVRQVNRRTIEGDAVDHRRDGRDRDAEPYALRLRHARPASCHRSSTTKETVPSGSVISRTS